MLCGAMPEGNAMVNPTVSVLMVVPNYPPGIGGLEHQAHILARTLVDQRCRVTVLTRRVSRRLPATEVCEGVVIVRLPSLCADACGKDWLFPLSLWWALLRFSPAHDVIHAHGITFFLLGCVLPCKLLTLPLLVKIPNVREQGLPGLRGRTLGASLIRLLQLADAWAVISEESRRELVAAGFPGERIFETHNGVDTAVFTPVDPTRRRALRAQLGLPLPSPVAVFAGRLVPQKGVGDLLSLWPQVRATVKPKPLLLICGDGPKREDLESIVRTRSIHGVRFAGAVQGIERYYQASDLFVLPSYAEGNSNAMMESMACGLPVVSTNVGGAPEMLGPHGPSCLVAPGDKEGLRKKLIRLLCDDELRGSLGMLLRDRVEREFRIERIARHYRACYRLLVLGRAHDVGGLNREWGGAHG